MKNNTISYLLIVLGGIITFYSDSLKNEYSYLLILGVCILMFGVYRLAKTLPSKSNTNETYIKEEPYNNEEE